MQVTVEDQSSVKKILHIEIPEDVVVREIDAAYQDLKKTAKVKGFRPGKAPRSVLERLYKRDVHADVSSKLIQSSVVDALKETELNIVGYPRVNPPELNTKGAYKYDAAVEIKPEIKSIDFKGLKLTKTLHKVSDEEIEAQLHMLQKNLATLVPLKEKRPAGEGDFVIIDYEGFKDGKPFGETQKTDNFSLKIGAGYISKDFDKELVGMTPGDTRDFEIHFNEDYYNKKLANKTIAFRVELKEIREEHLPAIDDKLAAQLGKFKSLDELKKEITRNLQQGYDKRIEQELNEQIFKMLIEKQDFELPEIMVDYELEGIISDAERSFAASNITMEQVGLTREKMSEKYRETAEGQVRRHLILDKIITQENLTVSDEETEDGFRDISEAFRQPIESIKDFYNNNKDKLELFKHTLLEKKAIRLIIDNSNMEEKEPDKTVKNDAGNQETIA